MLRTEIYGEEAGMTLIRTWDDAGNYIERDGALYVDAIDPEEMGRTYQETNITIQYDSAEEATGQEGEIPEEVPEEEPTEPEEGGTGSTIPLKPSKKY